MKKITILLLFITTIVFAQNDVVSFKADIKNANSDSIVIRTRGFSHTIKGHKGSFKDTFKASPGFYQLFDGTEQTSLYLKPGFDLSLKMDAKKFDESIKYIGKGEKENNFLAQLMLDMEQLSDKIAQATPEEQNTAITAKLEALENKLDDPEMDADFKNMVKMQLQGQKKQLQMMAEQAAKNNALNGKPSPVFNYENYAGGSTSLEDFKGKYVYIDVWATWCGPCRQQIPYLQKLEEEYKDEDIAFVSISIDKEKDHGKWQKMVESQSLGGTQLFADNDWNSEWTKGFGINSIPRFILIDPQGNIVNADAPRPSDPSLKQKLDKLLKK
ncbi:TlpA family protein disulfide reductase [Flavobacterium rhizosphaerae]|uniref:TlpA disulfide reductase family protein n=1 Tax=Flavobacterium rhizosphaerae TaxID=3163298 RepID=A0ABW8YVC1_9FLAO